MGRSSSVSVLRSVLGNLGSGGQAPSPVLSHALRRDRRGRLSSSYRGEIRSPPTSREAFDRSLEDAQDVAGPGVIEALDGAGGIGNRDEGAGVALARPRGEVEALVDVVRNVDQSMAQVIVEVAEGRAPGQGVDEWGD